MAVQVFLDWMMARRGQASLVYGSQVEKNRLMQIIPAIRFGRHVSGRARALQQELFRANLLVFQQPSYRRISDRDQWQIPRHNRHTGAFPFLGDRLLSRGPVPSLLPLPSSTEFLRLNDDPYRQNIPILYNIPAV